ncbi:S24/S26 family peptidase [Cytobacillus firmus]|uniref:S24/S26 family peptidase n=1 Tax=Cytobacillus firmus TaxID=1399 RepID=UPI001CFCCE06|nr:S24/S26 family peptidase [Cytobacillus firmus]
MLFDGEVIDLLKRTIQKDGCIDLPSVGDSMYPLIQKGEICRFIPCEPSLLNKGDITLFWAESGQLVAHRFYHAEMIHGLPHYVFKGDTNLGFDQPVGKDRIVGKLLYVQKASRKTNVEDLQAYAWGKLILAMPILSGILRKYLNNRKSPQF